METVKQNAHVEYVRAIKKLLPDQAFSPAPQKLAYLLAYMLALSVCWFLFRLTSNIALYAVLSLTIAHCLSCIALLAHELSHNAIIKNNRFQYPLEILAWGLNLIPATLWDRVHNHSHHVHANTHKDPDRRYLTKEKNKATAWYVRLFFPNKGSLKFNPLVWFHFITYIVKNVSSVFYKGDAKPIVVTNKPKYSPAQKRKIVLELAIICLLQVGVFFITGGKLLPFLFASPVAWLLTSSILMGYIFTNHFNNPVTEKSDPVMGTTSVQVPRLFNRLHFNFAYHTEHHIFPTMNSDYYPELSEILKEKYPDTYNYVPITTAWSKLWKNEEFLPALSKE